MSPYATELVHLEDVHPRSGLAARWQRARHRKAHWVAQCMAEAFGAFLYCFMGAAAAAAYTLGNIAGVPIGSLFTVGFGYGIGVVVALVVCASTSGGHINPCMTIVQIIFKGFPPLKGLAYIISQIFGAYVGMAFVYLQWRPTIREVEAVLTAKGVFEATMFQTTGPAGIFALYAPAGYPLGTVFLNEFMVCFVLSIIIFACLDPTNMLVPPAAVPWVAGMAYAASVWGFAVNGIALNTARDLGGRLFAMSVWGTAANGGTYAAIAALTNIPATIVAALVYDFVFSDSLRVLQPSTKLFIDAQHAHDLRLQRELNGTDVESLQGGSSSTEKI